MTQPLTPVPTVINDTSHKTSDPHALVRCDAICIPRADHDEGRDAPAAADGAQPAVETLLSYTTDGSIYVVCNTPPPPPNTFGSVDITVLMSDIGETGCELGVDLTAANVTTLEDVLVRCPSQLFVGATAAGPADTAS